MLSDYFSNQRNEFNDVDSLLFIEQQQHAQSPTKQSMSVQGQLDGSGSLDTKHQTLLTFNVVAFKQIMCECEIQLGNIPPFKDKTTHIPLS